MRFFGATLHPAKSDVCLSHHFDEASGFVERMFATGRHVRRGGHVGSLQ